MKFLLPVVCSLLLIGCSDSKTADTAAQNETQAVTASAPAEINSSSDVQAEVPAATAKEAAPAASAEPEKAASPAAPVSETKKAAPVSAPKAEKTAVPAPKIATASVDAGALFSQKCASCHGTKGEKAALGKSLIVSDFNEQQIKDALHGYQAGTYGKEMKALMQGQAKGLNDAQIDALAKHISEM